MWICGTWCARVATVVVALLVGLQTEAAAQPEWSVPLLEAKGPHGGEVKSLVIKSFSEHGIVVSALTGELAGNATALRIQVIKRKRGRNRWAAIVTVEDGAGSKLKSATFAARNPALMNRAVKAGVWKRLGESIELRRDQWLQSETKRKAQELAQKQKEDREKKEKEKEKEKEKNAPEKRSDYQGRVTSDLIHTTPDGKKLFRYETVAARRKGKIEIDGYDREPAWKLAKETMGNWKQRPDEMGETTGEVYFRVLFDDDAVYAYIFARDPEPKKVAGILTRGDTFNKSELSDWLIFIIDPTRSRRDSYGFQVNPEGVRIDYRIFNDTQLDVTYDPVYEVETRRLKDGWSAEYRIPYSQIRIKGGKQDRWGMQIWRRVSRTGEHYMWSPYPLQTQRGTSKYGDMVVDATLNPKRAFEVLAYTVGGIELRDTEPEDTLNDGTELIGKVGGDIQLALSSELKLTATVLPDFGQVEADPAQVNLTDREIFFQERRPFFTSDDDLFQQAIGGGFERLYYTRRIGAPPQVSQPGNFRDEPRETTIYTAAKVSGRLPGDIKVGAISVVTAEETSRAQDADGNVTTAVAEPTTFFNVLQLGRVFRGGASEIRFAGTSVNRLLKETDIDSLRRSAYTGGTSYLHRFADNTWGVSVQALGSFLEGPAPAIDRLQRSSVRYSQRPDATHVNYDPTRTSLNGGAYRVDVSKLAGKWTGSIGGDARTPGFETNDIGFLQDADYINGYARIGYEEWLGGGVRTYGGSVRYDTIGNFGGDVLRHSITGSALLRLDSDAQINGTYQQIFNRLDTRQLRGGPTIAGSNSTKIGGSYYTSPRRSAVVGVYYDYTIRPDSYSRRQDVGVELTWNILNNVDLVFSPSVSRIIDDTQFIGGLPPDANGDPRYLFGNIKRTDVSTIIRLNYTVTPRMSLQFYGQPFVSASNFRNYRQPTDLQSRNYDQRFTTIPSNESMGMVNADLDGDGVLGDLSFPSRDNSFSALNTNLVFRWEYRPGSFASAIWSHAASGVQPDGFLKRNDFSDVWTNDGAHVFLLKISYWWAR